MATPIAIAQVAPRTLPITPSQIAALDLPDAPGAISRSADPEESSSTSFTPAEAAFDLAPAGRMAMASATDKIIAPGQPAPSLNVGNKMLLGLKSSFSPFSATGWILSAGYSHVTNGSPNYGTNSGAFAQRFGAAVARGTSEGVFSDSIMASVLHEDPRYYQMGRSHSILRRAVYAATRTIITRTDSGRTTPNLALLSGNLAGSALTNVYYPPANQGFSQTMLTFGSSVGGSALGFVVSEFLGDALQILHLKKAE
ncbi:MAG: hypothetical protein ABI158_15555 [Edaphobacter sp.]